MCGSFPAEAVTADQNSNGASRQCPYGEPLLFTARLDPIPHSAIPRSRSAARLRAANELQSCPNA